MASIAFPARFGKRSEHKKPNNILSIPPQNNSDIAHAKEDEMTQPRRHEDETLQRIEQLLERLPGNKSDLGAWGRTFATMLVVLIGWVFSALYIAKSTETEIRVSNAVLTEKLNQTKEEFDEYKKTTQLELKLQDERYRQLSIAVEARGIKLPIR